MLSLQLANWNWNGISQSGIVGTWHRGNISPLFFYPIYLLQQLSREYCLVLYCIVLYAMSSNKQIVQIGLDIITLPNIFNIYHFLNRQLNHHCYNTISTIICVRTLIFFLPFFGFLRVGASISQQSTPCKQQVYKRSVIIRFDKMHYHG